MENGGYGPILIDDAKLVDQYGKKMIQARSNKNILHLPTSRKRSSKPSVYQKKRRAQPTLNLGQYLKHIVSHINPSQELLFGIVTTFKDKFDPNNHIFRWSRNYSFFLNELEKNYHHPRTVIYFANILVVPKGFEFSRHETKRFLSKKLSPVCEFCSKENSNLIEVEVVRDGKKCFRRLNIEVEEISQYDMWSANGFFEIEAEAKKGLVDEHEK